MQTDRTPTVLAGRYVLEERLGRSGVGMVWRGADRVLQRSVAVELIHPDLGDDPAFVARWTEDARALARISDPHLTRLLDTGSEDGVRFVVRELVTGETLLDRLTREGRLPPAEAARIATSVLSALETLHDHELLHLDVRPPTVLLATDHRVLLNGAAFVPALIATKPPSEAATYLDHAPLPPELIEGTLPDPRTDVYGVGALLHQMLTGSPPTPESISPRAIDKGVPKSLDAGIQRALAADPGARFPSAREFANALEPHARQAAGPGWSRGMEGTAGAAPAPPPPPRSWLRTWFLLPVGVLTTAAILIVAGLFFGKLEVGGPLGIRPAPQTSPSSTAPATGALAIAAVTTSDPFGDGSESDALAGAAIDGDLSTAWRSENYFDGRFDKPGVGLVFDLGAERVVTGFRLQTPHPGFSFQIAVGDDPAALADPGGESFTVAAMTRGSIEPVSGRYVMVWMTSVVPTGDGNRAEISEFRAIGRDA